MMRFSDLREKLDGRLIFAAILFAALFAYCFARWQSTGEHPYRAMELQGDWISAPGENSASAYLRKRFEINSPIKHAWLSVVAQDGFEVSVNRNPVGRTYLWRPTRPFQNGSSESGLAISHRKPAMALNFPREYQWDGHDNWLLPTFLDITSQLKTGKNVICLEIESRSSAAMTSFHGAIQLWNGEQIPITSGADWKAEPVPLGPQLMDWTEPQYWDKEWRQATVTDGPAQRAWRNAPVEIFSQPFNGNWMRSNSSLANSDGFQTNWNIESEVDEAWLRVVANRKFELFVNDQRINVGHRPDIDCGDWMIGRESALDPIANPELLDPDETANFFVGEKFANPRDAQADLREFKRLKIKTHLPFRNYKTTNRAEEGGEFDPTRTLAESRSTPDKPDLPAEKPIPNSLKRDRAIGGYLGYSVGRLLRLGDNKIEIRPVAADKMSWQPAFAVDGAARLTSGGRSELPGAEEWTCSTGNSAASLPIEVGPLALQRNQKLPPLHFRGVAANPKPFLARWVKSFLMIALATSVLLFLAGAWTRRSTSECCLPALFVGATVLLCGILLDSSLQERHETLWFERGIGWRFVLLLSLAASLLVGFVEVIRGLKLKHVSDFVRELPTTICELPHTRVWPYLICWMLLLCALLRGYKLDLQPLDDDEYASTQAIVAILETGAPSFVPENVYYTRSPMYHYLTAAIAWPFGGNLWSLRLQSVMWSVATALLVYLCGSRLLNNRWVGFGAMTLLCIHPFEIYTGHVIRFYQMQQFFALLTVYLFCHGFVGKQQQRYRVATLLVFMCAVLSQEISAVMGVPLLLGYILFAKDLGWRANIQLVIVSAAVMLVVAVDLLAFKTLCLTRTEGVSPNVEASIKPHFWYPMNMFSIFVGYSRLHVVASFFCFLGLPLFWRENNRNAFALLMFLFSGVLMTNLLVSHISLRYQYWLFPIWILVCLNAVRLIAEFLSKLSHSSVQTKHQTRVTTCAITALVFFSIVLSWSPWRIPGTYEMQILGNSTGCVRWVKSQMRPGDKLAISEPHTHAAYLESGKVDYDIAIPLLYDFAVFQDGRLIDRNGGGEIVGSLDQLHAVLEKQDRVWILLNREKFRTRGKNMRWEYPGARFEMFLRKNCELKHRTYLWNAYLWDASRGHLVSFSKQQ